MPEHSWLMRSKRLLAPSSLTLVILLAAFVPAARAQRGMTPDDTLKIANVSDAQISPDGEWIIYTVLTVEGNATHTALWLARSLRSAITFGRGAGADGRAMEILPAEMNAPCHVRLVV